MNLFTLTIDGHPVQIAPGQSVLDAARKLGLDIPTLCYLEKCGPLNSCQACLVKINGKLVPSCGTKAQPGMIVESETDEIHDARRTALELLFSDHVGDCLAPCNRLCPLRLNIPLMLRQVQAGNLDNAIAKVREALPLPAILGRLCHHPCEQGCRRGALDQAAGIRNIERMVADWDYRLIGSDHSGNGEVRSAPTQEVSAVLPHPCLPKTRPPTGKSVVIVGAGPTGLTAAYYLMQYGHACTIADRHDSPGGTLRALVDNGTLPVSLLAMEVRQIERLGAQFKPGAVLGHDITIDGLLRGFDAVLLTLGELTKAEGEALGLEMTPAGIEIDLETMQTARPSVFAAGRVVKPMNQLVRAMSEGQVAAFCLHQFLLGRPVHRPEKPVASVMGRLDKDELDIFSRSASSNHAVSPCDACAGFTKQEGATEAARCLHCDCRSSGDCALQSYAQAYGADASRFRQQRRKFEQQMQPGGVIFEPGKCIVCGICVKLTELAQEPLGLTFIGRGFDVRVATPFERPIADGLQRVAEECVRHCPTGALTFAEAMATKETPK